MVMSHSKNFQNIFKHKLLGLHELKKWKRMIQILIETQFGTYQNEVSSYDMDSIVSQEGQNENIVIENQQQSGRGDSITIAHKNETLPF